ncbi:hypothetical protein Leryth_020609 [Lithospermum erythrorhizon]|nr:hypothetical protein Leryth_020609 [Lithospermum erythrorhizon]
MVVIHVIGSYQVYAMPVFEMLEESTVRKLKIPPGIMMRIVVRSAYVAMTLFIGVTFPFFGDLLGFLGGFGFTPTTFILPSVFWLKMKKPKRFSASWVINWTS